MSILQESVLYIDFGNDTAVNNSVQSVSFKDLANEWLWLFKKEEVTPRSFECYLKYIKNLNIIIGDMPVKKINISVVQTMLNALSKKYAVKTLKGQKTLFNCVMEYAIDKGLINSNPTRKCKIKKADRDITTAKKIKAIPPKLRGKLLDVARENPIMNPIVITMMYSGLRPGELIALKWRNLDFNKCTITVEGAATYSPDYDMDGNLIINKSVLACTKTEAGTRTIRVPKIVLQAIKVWEYDLKSLLYKKSKYECKPDDFVFVNRYGKMRSYSSLKNLFDRFNKNNYFGMKINPHMLRHTFATILLEEGINPKVVQQMLGHTDVRLTLNTYSHVFSEVFDVAANTMEKVYAKTIQDKNNNF